jgi:hypothetical protein
MKKSASSCRYEYDQAPLHASPSGMFLVTAGLVAKAEDQELLPAHRVCPKQYGSR